MSILSRTRLGVALAASVAAAGALIAVGAPAQASDVAVAAQSTVVAPAKAATKPVAKPAGPSSKLITQINTVIHKKKGLGKTVNAVQISTYSVAPAWVYVNADSKKFGSVDVLLQFSAKKWHVKDFGTAEVGCGTAPKKLLRALDQNCPGGAQAASFQTAAKPASPSGTLITQINTTIHKKKGLGKGVHAVQVSTYAVAPAWVYVNADSKKFGSVDVLLQFSAKKWHVKDFGTAEVGCGTAPKKLLKALGQHC